MKELSIEEKAKRYDEAIENAKTLYENANGMILKKWVERVFPELKKDEGEEIRKWIIDDIRYNMNNEPLNNSEYKKKAEKAITWLEKQSIDISSFPEEQQVFMQKYTGLDKITLIKLLAERDANNAEIIESFEKQSSEPNWCHHKVDLSDCSEEYRKAYYDGWNNCNMQHSQCKLEKSDVLKCLINGFKFYYEDNKEATWGTQKFSMKVKNILSWLEKQGNQKSIDDLTQQEAMDIAVAKCFEQGEQKLADNVEPKFKVGDWVTNGDNTTQIVAVGTGLYIINRKDMSEVSLSTEYIEKWYHLWTIQDAKDGDILVHNDCTFIFMGIKNGIVQALEENLFNGTEACNFGELSDKNNDYRPATKEECDIFIAKIKELGYEWDAEKKELKKIEQKPAEWSEDDEQYLLVCKNALRKYQVTDKWDSSIISQWLDNKLKSLRPQPKQEWSEEDEKIALSIEQVMNCASLLNIVPEKVDKIRTWLKSLKKRIIN